MKNLFPQLKQYAEAQNEAVPKDSAIIVFMTKNGNMCHVILPIFLEPESAAASLKALLPQDDNTVSAAACFFSEGDLEIPAYAFRKALVDLNDANLGTLIFMNGENVVISKPLSDTMPLCE